MVDIDFDLDKEIEELLKEEKKAEKKGKKARKEESSEPVVTEEDLSLLEFKAPEKTEEEEEGLGITVEDLELISDEALEKAKKEGIERRKKSEVEVTEEDVERLFDFDASELEEEQKKLEMIEAAAREKFVPFDWEEVNALKTVYDVPEDELREMSGDKVFDLVVSTFEKALKRKENKLGTSLPLRRGVHARIREEMSDILVGEIDVLNALGNALGHVARVRKCLYKPLSDTWGLMLHSGLLGGEDRLMKMAKFLKSVGYDVAENEELEKPAKAAKLRRNVRVGSIIATLFDGSSDKQSQRYCFDVDGGTPYVLPDLLKGRKGMLYTNFTLDPPEVTIRSGGKDVKLKLGAIERTIGGYERAGTSNVRKDIFRPTSKTALTWLRSMVVKRGGGRGGRRKLKATGRKVERRDIVKKLLEKDLPVFEKRMVEYIRKAFSDREVYKDAYEIHVGDVYTIIDRLVDENDTFKVRTRVYYGKEPVNISSDEEEEEEVSSEEKLLEALKSRGDERQGRLDPAYLIGQVDLPITDEQESEILNDYSNKLSVIRRDMKTIKRLLRFYGEDLGVEDIDKVVEKLEDLKKKKRYREFDNHEVVVGLKRILEMTPLADEELDLPEKTAKKVVDIIEEFEEDAKGKAPSFVSYVKKSPPKGFYKLYNELFSGGDETVQQRKAKTSYILSFLQDDIKMISDKFSRSEDKKEAGGLVSGVYIFDEGKWRYALRKKGKKTVVDIGSLKPIEVGFDKSVEL